MHLFAVGNFPIRQLYLVILSIFFHGAAVTFILRLPCKLEGHFGIKINAYKLINSTIAHHTVSNVEECQEKCKFNQQCRSINYRDFGDGNCQLNNKIKQAMRSKNWLFDDVWTYYATDYNISNVGSYCQAFQPCSPTKVCVDTCHCPGYKCTSKCNIRYYEDLGYVKNLTNLALGKPVSASSVYDSQTIPENAVDGNLFSSHKTCSLTKRNKESRSWLRVDLIVWHTIVYVQLKSREVSRAVERSQPFDVFVGSKFYQRGGKTQFCFKQCEFDTADTLKRFDCPPGIRGRFIGFFTGYNTHLDICEFEIYGFR